VGTVLTQSADGSRLYIHLLEYPFSELKMKHMAGKLDYAQFLHDASELRFRENADGTVNFIIPGIRPDQTISVVELFLK
jgi:alpha-L-fucosidase